MARREKISKQTLYYYNELYYPVFVYGTLLSGMYNYLAYLDGYTIKEEPGEVPGKIHLVSKMGSFPVYFDKDPQNRNGVVKGELVYIRPYHYPQVLASLDHLEGYNPLSTISTGWYKRILTTVKTVSGEKVKAWVYLFTGSVCTVGPKIPNGDFREWAINQGRQRRR